MSTGLPSNPPRQTPGCFVIGGIIAAIVVGVGMTGATYFGWMIYSDFRSNSSTVQVNGTVVGKNYAGPIVEAWAVSMDTVGDEIGKSGAKVGEAIEKGVKARADSADTSYKLIVYPSLHKLLPEGTEPRDDEHRAAVAKFFHDAAKGARSQK